MNQKRFLSVIVVILLVGIGGYFLLNRQDFSHALPLTKEDGFEEGKKFYVLKGIAMNDLMLDSFDIKSITKKFYEQHPDNYDFLAIVTGFLVGESVGQVPPSFTGVKNDVKGIRNLPRGYQSSSLFDYSADYGSDGKLRGIIFINDIDNAMGLNKFFGINAVIHEIGHTWLMYLGDDRLKINREGSLGSNFVDAIVRINGKIYPNPGNGGIWQENADGTFSGLNIPSEIFTEHSYRFRYTSLDLYLMGLIPASKTQPILLINPKEMSQEVTNQNVIGTKYLITIGDLIKLGGPREPAYPNTQNEFTIALILVVKKEVTESQFVIMNWIAKNLPEAWAEATNHNSELIIK